MQQHNNHKKKAHALPKKGALKTKTKNIMDISKLCQFFHVYARTYAHPCGLIFGHLCQFSSIMLAIWRYFDISCCLPVLLLIILRSMHVQQYVCLVFVVDHTTCMVFDYGKYIRQYCIYSIIHSLYILCSHFHKQSVNSWKVGKLGKHAL